MDNEGADCMVIVVCVLAMSLLLNAYFLHGVWTANRQFAGSENLPAPGSEDPQFLGSVGTLHRYVDEVMSEHQKVCAQNRTLREENEQLLTRNAELSDRLHEATLYLYGISYTHYLYFLGKGIP